MWPCASETAGAARMRAVRIADQVSVYARLISGLRGLWPGAGWAGLAKAEPGAALRLPKMR